MTLTLNLLTILLAAIFGFYANRQRARRRPTQHMILNILIFTLGLVAWGLIWTNDWLVALCALGLLPGITAMWVTGVDFAVPEGVRQGHFTRLTLWGLAITVPAGLGLWSLGYGPWYIPMGALAGPIYTLCLGMDRKLVSLRRGPFLEGYWALGQGLTGAVLYGAFGLALLNGTGVV